MSSNNYLTVKDLEGKLREFEAMPEARIGMSIAGDNMLQLEVLHPNDKRMTSVIGVVPVDEDVEVRSATSFMFWKWLYNMVMVLAVSCVLGTGAALAVFFFRVTSWIFGLG